MRIFDYIVGLISVLSLFFTYRSATYVRKKRLNCKSLLKVDDKIFALIKVRNLGAPNITIEKVALSLIVWEDSPRLQLSGFKLILQMIDSIWNYQRDRVYISQSKIRYPSDFKFPLTLTESQSVEVSIDIKETINDFCNHCEYLDRENYIWFMFRTLTIDVVCTNKVYKFKPNREIKYYMWSQYKNIDF